MDTSTALTEQGTMHPDAGDVGGDAQFGPAYNRRFIDGADRLVKVYIYAAVNDTSGTVDPDDTIFYVEAQWCVV